MNQQTKKLIVDTLPAHRTVVYRNVLSKVNDPSVAEDITQDTFKRAIECLRKKPDYYETGKERSWLLTISTNLCMDYFRLTKRKPIVPLSSNTPGGIDEGKAKEMLKKERAHEVHALIEQLPPEQREIVALRYFYGFKFKEIALMKNVSVNTCTGQMRYALMHMRALLAKQKI